MTRLFVSLYVFLALVLVGLSAALEPLFFSSPDALPAEARTIIRTFEQQADTAAKREAFLAHYTPTPAVIPLASLAFSAETRAKIQRGEVIPLFYQDSVQLYAAAGNNQLYEFTFALEQKSPRPALYRTVFFLLLGLLLALWIWPLWRDLSTITRGLAHVNDDGSFNRITLPRRSVVAPIARALNRLSAQVTELFNRHKEMTGAVAHELRTPLARLKFALASDKPATAEGWQAMREDVNELERMVQEMLDYMRNDGRPPELNVSHIPMRSLLEGTAERCAQRTENRVSIEIADDEADVLGDGYYLERAVENLILNAIRYAHSKVLLRIEQLDGAVIVHVEDDGPGVSEDNREKIFAPFYRPDPSRSRERGGAGLGLAIVRRIMIWHDGECSVSTSALGGADFTLTFPPLNAGD